MLIDQEWYEKHKDDITEEDIGSLGIEVILDGKKLGYIRQSSEKGKLKAVLESQNPEERANAG